jgi:hypothetical protein
MNTDNYNNALDRLVFYRRMCVVLAGTGTPYYSTYVGKLSAGSNILAIASGKDFDEVDRDVRDAYDSKYRR